MTIAHTMRNTGSKPIVTNVYNHNFTTIDKQPVGPDVEVSVPWQMTRVAGRGGRGAPAPPAGGAGAPAPQAPPPVNPAAVLAAGERMGPQCGQPQMQSLASAQGTKSCTRRCLMCRVRSDQLQRLCAEAKEPTSASRTSAGAAFASRAIAR